MTVLSRPTLRPLVVAAVLGLGAIAHAQSAPVDADKQKVIDQILQVWHPENAVVMAVQRPAAQAMEQSRIALEQKRLPKEKIEPALKDIAVDVQKYVDTATPGVIASAKKNIGSTVVPQLAQNFSLDELKQLLALLQSPVKAKFEKILPQVDQSLGKKVQDEVGADINKDIQTMQQAVGTKLRAAATAAESGK